MPDETRGLLLGAEVAKEIIALATGVTALTMTFAEKFGGCDGTSFSVPWSLKASWIFLAFSLVFSIWTLMSITGTLNELDTTGQETNPKRSNITIPARLMMTFFALGLTSAFISGFRNWL